MEHNIVPVKAGQILAVKPNWLQEKREEVKRGEQALVEIQKIEGISKTRIGRIKGRLRFLKKFVSLLEQGYIPIPRMDFTPIDLTLYNYGQLKTTLYLDPMPVEAIATIAEFQKKFDHLGLVKPRQKGRRRDPLLIGVISYGRVEEHFLLGWWRPDLIKPAELW